MRIKEKSFSRVNRSVQRKFRVTDIGMAVIVIVILLLLFIH